MDKQKIANGFSKFFSGTVARLLDSIGSTLVSMNHYISTFVTSSSNLRQEHLPSFKFETVTQHFIVTELCRLKICKVVGLDNISSRLLKDAAEIIAEPLTRIIIDFRYCANRVENSPSYTPI